MKCNLEINLYENYIILYYCRKLKSVVYVIEYFVIINYMFLFIYVLNL